MSALCELLKQEWFLGVILGFLLGRLGASLDAKSQARREKEKLFNSYIDELNGHDRQIELLLRAPDSLRPLDMAVWQQVKVSGELWSMDQTALNHIATYGEVLERYNYHFQEVDWLTRELLNHPSKDLSDYVKRSREKLTEMLKQMQTLKRDVAFECRWWMIDQKLFSKRRWKKWMKASKTTKSTDKL